LAGEEWALAASAFFAGLASGLLGMLSTIMRPMLAAMDGRDFRNFMEAFLRYADNGWGKVFNYAWSIGMTIGPVVALVLLWDDPGSTSFVLTAIGLGIVIVGVYVVANVWKEPHYKVDAGLGSRGHAGGLGGGTAALLHDQLDPIGDDLGGVRPIPRGSGLHLGGPRGRRAFPSDWTDGPGDAAVS
jgi:MFS family permease